MAEQQTVLLGMSGGVDSSVTAHLLRQKGFRVVGATMKLYPENSPIRGLSETISGCYGPGAYKGIKAAQDVAARLGIEHHVIPLTEEYQREVLDYFRSEYLKGRTPNPCVRCNQMLKFGFLHKKAKELGIDFDYFATGHYCRIVRDAQGVHLVKAKDPKKDQSYFLSRLKREQLKNIIFPLGDYTKEEIKDIAREIGWRDLAEKHESQDFIAADKYSVLFKAEDFKAGEIRDTAGHKIGEHQGVINYTIGQRRGVGLGGGAEALYVVGIDTVNNTITVGGREDLAEDNFIISEINIFEPQVFTDESKTLSVKIRQTARPVAAKVSEIGETARVHLLEPQLAVTPGQIAVFYYEDTLIASGIIEKKL